MPSTSRIDVHHHFVPPKFNAVLQKNPTAEWIVPKWSVSASQSLMQKVGTSTAILSLTSPGVDVVDSASDQLELAQDANDTAAAARDANSSQFGFFATIPNPIKHLKEAMSELTRAFDDLHADGVTLLTQYDGKYLGNEAFSELWTELNNRKAVVFIHPTSPPPPYEPIRQDLPPPMLDFTFETTKAACDLLMGGVISRCPDLKIILSHGGGTLPFIWHRVAQLPKYMKMGNLTYEQFRDQASSFYFDTALTGYGPNIELLLTFAKPGHVLYGSDFPYAPNGCTLDMTSGLDEVLNKKETGLRDAVGFGNALELFSRFKQDFRKLKAEGGSKI